MAIRPDYDSPVSDGDAGVAVAYRLTDADGSVWRSSPYVMANALRWEETVLNASGQWLLIPTLRHLMEGTTALIEIYIGQVDLNLFHVMPNDPSVDFIEFSPNALYLQNGLMPNIKTAVERAGIGEVLYTTGGALPNMPPPSARALWAWRNRAFCADKDTVYYSQEFATGLGIQWNETLRSDWTDGTGGITALCHIDWNYLAIFKEDAIGILSGPGPDGLGHGAYIVQTLSTKAGCKNVKSLVNGADGCYFQDAQTGRLMLLSPDLQVRECAPGAFDYSSHEITGALHVEHLRQIWFLVTDTNKIIVLDYKHRTESSPMGSVYVWTFRLGAMAGSTIRAGSAELALESGDIAVLMAGQSWDEASNGSEIPILQSLTTGEMQPVGLLRQFNVCRVQALGEYVSEHVFKLTTYPNFSASGSTVQANVTAGPSQFVTRPPNLMRTQSVRVKIDEAAYAPGNIKTTLVTTGGYVSALASGSLTLSVTLSDGTTQTATKAASAWAVAGAGLNSAEIDHVLQVPPDLTITAATLTVVTGFSGTGITNVTASVRRDGGTAGEIFSGKSALTPTTFTSGTLALASSLGLTPVLGAGFKFVGLALELQDAGKISNPGVGRII